MTKPDTSPANIARVLREAQLWLLPGDVRWVEGQSIREQMNALADALDAQQDGGTWDFAAVERQYEALRALGLNDHPDADVRCAVANLRNANRLLAERAIVRPSSDALPAPMTWEERVRLATLPHPHNSGGIVLHPDTIRSVLRAAFPDMAPTEDK
jgi:hypothetical protein